MSNIDNMNKVLRELNKVMNEKLLSMIKNRERVIWDYERINHVLVCDEDENDLLKAINLIPEAFSIYKYKTEFKYLKGISEFNTVRNIRFYMTFLDYKLKSSNDMESIIEKLKSQHIIIFTGWVQNDVKQMAKKYDCYFLVKPYTIDSVRRMINMIQSEVEYFKEEKDETRIT